MFNLEIDYNLQTDERWTIFLIVFGYTSFFISLVLTIARIVQIYYNWKANSQFPLLLFSHLYVMISYTIFIFFFAWNYHHFYYLTTSVTCTAFSITVLVLFHTGRICLYNFLFLRSKYSFDNSIMQFNPYMIKSYISIETIVGIVITITTCVTARGYRLNNFSSFCTREYNPEFWLYFGHFWDVSVATFSLIVFITKSYGVKQQMRKIQVDYKEYKVIHGEISQTSTVYQQHKEYQQLYSTFKKHILLGSLTVSTSIIYFFALLLLRVLLGALLIIDTVSNVIYIFLMFNSNEKLYKYCCGWYDAYFKTESANDTGEYFVRAIHTTRNEQNSKDDNDDNNSGKLKVEKELVLYLEPLTNTTTTSSGSSYSNNNGNNNNNIAKVDSFASHEILSNNISSTENEIIGYNK